MILSKTLEKHYYNEEVVYELLQNDIVGMGARDGVHSYSIIKKYNVNSDDYHFIARGIKSAEAITIIWNDVKEGIQK